MSWATETCFPERLTSLEPTPITMQPDTAPPIVALRLAVKGGRPVPVYVAIVREEWAELLSEDLRIPLTRMVDEVIRFEKQQIFERFTPPPSLSGLGPGVLAAHGAWGNRFNTTGSERTPRRRSVTPERLEEVAVIYQPRQQRASNDSGGGSVEHVAFERSQVGGLGSTARLLEPLLGPSSQGAKEMKGGLRQRGSTWTCYWWTPAPSLGTGHSTAKVDSRPRRQRRNT